MITEREQMMALVDNDIIYPSDAIILLEGDGLSRYSHAVKLFEDGSARTIVFSGGITDYQYGSFPFSDVLPHILKLGVPKSAIVHESKSLNTKEQAVEVIELAIKNRWGRLILVASPEHQYRVYLTFLREVIDRKLDIVIFNSPVKNLKWFGPCDWGVRFDRIVQEFERIDKYSESGHLATYKEVIDYQLWKEQQ